MNFLKTHKNKIIIVSVAVLALAAAFMWGGNAPGLGGFKEESKKSSIAEPKIKRTPSPKTEQTVSVPELSPVPYETALPKRVEEPIPMSEETVQYEEAVISDISADEAEKEDNSKILSCTMSVRCDTILNNMQWLNEEKRSLIPEDGVIFPTKTVVFSEGESVFGVLLREMKNSEIHMEYTKVPMYDGVYIEGINNIYEFDCGERSGWMYSVNGYFPNYGSSQYTLKNGDVIEWRYTCELGDDVR